jgi:hypothetical protein
MAYLSALINNLAIGIHCKKGTKQKTIMDFMPNWSGEKKLARKQTIEEMKAVLNVIARGAPKIKDAKPLPELGPDRVPRVISRRSRSRPNRPNRLRQ